MNESAIVVDGNGTLNFFKDGDGTQTLKIRQGSAESRGESSAIVNQDVTQTNTNIHRSTFKMSVNGSLDIEHYARSYVDDDAATLRFISYPSDERQELTVTGDLKGYTDVYRTNRLADMAFMFVENTDAKILGNVDISLKAVTEAGAVYGVRNRAFNTTWQEDTCGASDIVLGSASKLVRIHDVSLLAADPDTDEGEGAEAYGLISTGLANDAGTPIIRVAGDAVLENITATVKSDADSARAFATGAHAADDGEIIFERGALIQNIGAAVNAEGTVSQSGAADEKSEAYALTALNGGKISVNTSADAEAKVQINGNLLAFSALKEGEDRRASSIAVNLLNADSVFTGLTLGNSQLISDAITEELREEEQAKIEDGEEGDPNITPVITAGTINLQFANGATWNVPETNTLHGTLTLKNGGLVVLGEDGASSLARTAAAAPVELTVDKLEGTGGIFSMQVSNEQGITDHLRVNEGTGSHLIRLRSTGTEPTHDSLTSLVDEVTGDAAFSLEGDKVDMGLYSYKLDSYENDGMTSWRLVQAGDAGGSDEPGNDPVVPDNPPKPELSNSAQAVLALGNLGSQVTQHLNGLSDLRKRMGEVRGDAGTGLWVQAIDQKDRFNGFAGTGFKQRSYRFNFGVDHAIGNWIVGANFKHVTSDQKTRGGVAKGDSHDEGLNLYATYRAENGSYADFVLSADKNHQHLSTSMIDGTPVSGSYHNTGLGASVEIGHQFVVSEAQQLFVEPQAELSYYMAKGADFTLTNGMKVSQKNYESLTGRLGAVFGKNFLDAQGRRIGQAAMHAGWKGELAGNNRITVNGVDFTDRLLKNRFYYGLNGNLAVTENLSLYGYVEREQGQGYTKEVEAGIGMKYRF